MSGYLVSTDGSPGETLLTRTLPLTTILDYETFYGNGSIMFKKLRNTIANVLIVSAVNGSVNNVRQGMRPVAQECVLMWCVKTMRSSYDSGRYKEDILHTFFNTTEGHSPWISTPFQTDDQNGTDNFYLQDVHINLGLTPEGRMVTGFGTPNYTASSNIQGFQDVFPSFTTSNDDQAQPMMRWKTWQRGSPWIHDLEYNPWMAPNNVTLHMERLATAMTNVIRSAPSRNILPGQAFFEETFVSVQWEWLAFPFMLLILSLIFLVSTMVKTSQDGAIGMWKTSAMPILIQSLPPDVQKDMLSVGSAEQAPETKRVRIRLLPERVWRVSGLPYIPPNLKQREEQRGPTGWI